MLSAIIVAWNEAHNLSRALNSLAGLVDEIVVVVDEATTDDTAAIAKKYHCKIFTHPHLGFVEPMRNFAISKASGDWILLLDADEELSPELAAHISKFLTHPSSDYLRFPRKNLIFGKWITSAHWWPDYVYRLFKRDTLTWTDAIHSLPQTHGTGLDLPANQELALLHYNYSTLDEYLEQIVRYTKPQSELLISQGYKFIWTDLITKPADEFISQYFARQGYKEGVHGLALGLLQAFSELILYLRVWEGENFRPQSTSVDQLTHLVSAKTSDYRWWYWQTKINGSSLLRKLCFRLARKFGL